MSRLPDVGEVAGQPARHDEDCVDPNIVSLSRVPKSEALRSDRHAPLVAGTGVGALTVFGFSTENWTRPAREVTELMRLMKTFVRSDLDDAGNPVEITTWRVDSAQGPVPQTTLILSETAIDYLHFMYGRRPEIWVTGIIIAKLDSSARGGMAFPNGQTPQSV